MKRYRIVAGLLVLALLAGLLGWMRWRAPLADVIELRAAPLVRTVQFSARVATLSRVDIGSTLTGRVAQVRVREGDRVRAGDELVRLESDEARALLAQAQAAETQAAARLRGLRSTGRAQAQAAQAQADATVLAARAELERAQQLVGQGFVSASRLDDARRALAVAQAQQDSVRAQAQANAEGGTDALQAQAQLDLARATTTAARARLEQAVLRAPADARVLAREVEPGQIVQPGRTLLSLALAGPTRLKAPVDERFLDQLQVGQPAAVVADAFADQRMAARVLGIAPLVDAQRGAVEVTLALERDPPAFLREDMTLSAEVETARRGSALVLPLAALRPSGTEALVLQDGRAQARRLRLGLRTLEAVEVLDGLAEGDAVLLDGTTEPGRRLRPRPVAPGDVRTAPRPGASGAAAAALTGAMGR